MLGDLTDKVAIVTGAGQGIGAAIAQVFARAGAKVMIATRTPSHGEDTLKAILDSGGCAELMAIDIGSPEAVDSIVEKPRRSGGASISWYTTRPLFWVAL